MVRRNLTRREGVQRGTSGAKGRKGALPPPDPAPDFDQLITDDGDLIVTDDAEAVTDG